MIVDTNLIIRYLINDIEEQFTYSKNIFENNDIYIPNEILAEAVYVLEKVYKIPRNEIRDALEGILEYPNISSQKDLLQFSLEVYADSKLDYIDCLLVSYHKVQHENIISFDRDLLKRMDR